MTLRTTLLAALLMPLAAHAQGVGQAPDPMATGRATFEQRCATCHGADGNGGELGPAIARRLESLDDEQVRRTITQGLPTRGMPPHEISATDLSQLLGFLRTLRPRPVVFASYHLSAQLVSGGQLQGTVVGEGFDDVQLRGDDNQLHLLRRAAGGRYRAVTSQVDWPSYNGSPGGNRFTTLAQITPANVRRVAPRWVFDIPNASRLQTTPVVAGGIMYVTNGNECFALDAGSGRPIWHFQREKTRGLIGNATGGFNRGVALAGNLVYMVTDNAHLLALDRSTGAVIWETTLADWRQNYNATSAPLVVGNLVITGSAGGEEGVRGFIAAFDQVTGREVWRFWTVPQRGEPGSETWHGEGIEHGGATAWFTGVYDASTDTVFWPTGNPGNDYNGDERDGDNLYSDCILALDPKTGKLKWYYQTTPHDVWDWDASETPLPIDATWHGQPRKLLVQGNRNGFFYVLDRVTGKLLLGKQFVRELTWANGIDANGRPNRIPGQEPSAEGHRVCPAQAGGTNWYSPSYNPATGLFYMQTNEHCSIYTKRPTPFEYGRALLGGAVRIDVNPKPQRILKALDLQTGEVKWQLPQVGIAASAGGTLSTSTGLVFFGDDSGAFAAADALTGAALWKFDLGAAWRASPMTYQFDGRQLIGVAAGGSIVAFGLVE